MLNLIPILLGKKNYKQTVKYISNAMCSYSMFPLPHPLQHIQHGITHRVANIFNTDLTKNMIDINPKKRLKVA